MTAIRKIDSGPMDSNIFLLLGEGGGILIDAGTGSCNDAVIRRIKEELEGARLVGAVLTHEHFDHSGGMEGIRKEFDIPVHASGECAGIVGIGDNLLTGSFLFGSIMDPVEDVIGIEGDLSIGGIEFEVHDTPGHARGMISLIEKESRALFCGDLVFCDGGVGRWDLPGGSLEKLRSSIRAASTWDISSLYPGHGRYEERDPKREIETALKMVEGALY